MIVSLLAGLEPQHWLILGLILLIAEMASGTTYLLWPAVAAFATGALAYFALVSWPVELALFAVLVIVLTLLGRPLVRRFRAEGAAHLNERGAQMVGGRAIVTAFANGVGSVKINDSIWRAVSDEALAPGENVEIAAVDGATLKVKRAR